MAWNANGSEGALQIRFWGVRGSMCVSGPEFMEFGGHTLCLEVRCGTRLFIVDAGSGLAALGRSLGGAAPAEIDLLLSHLHLDHIMGLPFFKPAILGQDRVIRTYCGHLGGEGAQSTFEKLFAPPIFPVGLKDLPTRFEHHGFHAGEALTLPDGTTVDTHALNHPGGATGYRFRHGGRSACYLSDLEHTDPWPDPKLAAFVSGADLVIYDGMFAEAEYSWCKGWGHSTWHKGVELCRAADVKALAIVHHCPGHTDIALREIEAELQSVMPAAFLARERQAVTLGAGEHAGAVAGEGIVAKLPAE